MKSYGIQPNFCEMSVVFVFSRKTSGDVDGNVDSNVGGNVDGNVDGKFVKIC